MEMKIKRGKKKPLKTDRTSDLQEGRYRSIHPNEYLEASQSQVLVSIIKTLSQCLSLNLLQGHSQDLLGMLESTDKIVAICPEFEDIIIDIKGKLMCTNCKVNPSTLATHCKHQFCNECFCNSLKDQTNGLVVLNKTEKGYLNLRCPLYPQCPQQIDIKDIRKAFPDWRELESNALRREARKTGIIECSSCQIIKDKKSFEKGECKHQCKECLYTDIRKGITKCKVCYAPFNNLYEIKQRCTVCEGCLSNKSIVEDCVSEVCHKMCKDCLKKSLDSGECYACNKALSNENASRIKEILYPKCEVCEVRCDASYFVGNQCCFKKICCFCQLESGHDCKVCGILLNTTEIRMLTVIEENIKSLASKEPEIFNCNP